MKIQRDQDLKQRIIELENENHRLKEIFKKIYPGRDVSEIHNPGEILSRLQVHENGVTELLNATFAILKTEDFEKTAKTIFKSCARTIGAQAGYVALLSDDGSENELLFLEDGGMPCHVDPKLPMPVRGLRAEAYRTGLVVFENDFMKSQWVKYMPKGHMNLKNVLFSPLNIEGKTVGIMGLAGKNGNFNDDDARIAKAFGDFAAIALQNSRTLENLSNLNATKDKFFSIISHDLRSPFNSIIGFSELVLEEIENDNKELSLKYARTLRKTAGQLLHLLNQLLDWSRIQREKFDFYPEKINLSGFIDEVIYLYFPEAEIKNIEIIKDLDVDTEILADYQMLHTIVRNLLSNAIKFTNEKGKVTISAQADKQSVLVSVADTGVGMKSSDTKKLFKIDKSFSKPGTKMENGSGLGLILCKEFVKIHGGHIGVSSQEGLGSTFWFSLPNYTGANPF